MGPRRDAAPALLAFQLQTSVSNGLLQTCSSETAPTFLCVVTAEHTTETSQQHSSRVTVHTRELHHQKALTRELHPYIFPGGEDVTFTACLANYTACCWYCTLRLHFAKVI